MLFAYANRRISHDAAFLNTDVLKFRHKITVHIFAGLSYYMLDVKKKGFLPGCDLIFKSEHNDGRDYHSEMNSNIFMKWIVDQLSPVLPANSTIVMDNASYHSIREEGTKAPTTATRKGEMQA